MHGTRSVNLSIVCLGMLPLTFENPSDYDRISPSDRLSLRGLNDIAPGKVIHVLDHQFGTYAKFSKKLTTLRTFS